jgi:hypothetical protein
MAQFGYANVSAESQTPVHGPGYCFIEQTAVFIDAAYFDSTRLPYLPSAVQYRIDDLTSGDNILPWTALKANYSTPITVTSEQNALISLTRMHECHQVLIAITDDEGTNYARVVFDLLRVPGLV